MAVSNPTATPPVSRQPVTSEFTPKFISTLREGYNRAAFQADVLAGLTVAIVALPLSMAIAIGSGAKPEQGLYAAIIGGFLISLLGGSRFQIGGPAGAFIVLVATTIARFGYEGLMVATIMAGLLMLTIGYLRLGVYVKYIPHPVTIGFTAGIAVIIFSGEIHDLFGLHLASEPGPIIPKISALWSVKDSFTPLAVGVSLACLTIILGFRAWRPRFPGLLLAVGGAAFVTWAFNLPIETIGSRFGGIPSALPTPHLPTISADKIIDLIPSAIAIALLGSIESLLSAVVADGMTGRRHRSNCELVAQGWANIASAIFGGLCVTGTIARTATNIRANAFGPIAGILHALFILIFILVAAPLAVYIPLAALAAVLATVAWNMVEKAEIVAIFRNGRGEAAVFLATLLLTIFRDLTEGIAVGVTMGALLFMHRMAESVQVELHQPAASDEDRPHNPNIAIYRLSGPLFFGAASAIAASLDRVGEVPKVFVLDLSPMPLIDSTGARELEHFVQRARARGVSVFFAGGSEDVLKTLQSSGMSPSEVGYTLTIEDPRIAEASIKPR